MLISRIYSLIIIIYLSLCLSLLHVASVDGFGLVSTVGSDRSLLPVVHQFTRTNGDHGHYTSSKISCGRQRPATVNINTRRRRLEKYKDYSHTPEPSSNTVLKMIPLHTGCGYINVQQSIGMGIFHLLLGSLGTPIVAKAITIWYTKIEKPKWTPPNRIFAPTWTILYTLMGIAFSRILQQLNNSTWNHPLILIWIGHMILNIIWAPIFFGLQQLRMGLYINCSLLFSLGGIILPWYTQIDMIAAYMIIPYVIWLSYATCLNVSICLRNPGPYNTAKFYSDLYKLQQKARTYAYS